VSGIAARTGAELIVVYADTFEPPAEFTATQVRHLAEAIAQSKRKTAAELERYVAANVAKDVRWKTVVADGPPATSIARVAEAEDADMIALGTHGRGGLQRLVLGSVAEAVIREASVPVLTLHSTEEPPEIRRALVEKGAAASIVESLGAEVTSVDGDRVAAIADSGEYDLIVIGAEQRSITRHARTPVLTVKTRANALAPATSPRF
jgi:nucleotide-binding universal stress UspA family protein